MSAAFDRPAVEDLGEPPPWPDDDGAIVSRESGPIDARIPPHDLDAERALVGGLLRADPRCMAVAGDVSADAIDGAHGRVYAVCLELLAEGIEPSLELVTTRLRAIGRLAEVGGVASLTELAERAPVPSPSQAREYARVVRQMAAARAAIVIGQRVQAQGYAGVEAESVIESAISDLSALRPRPAASLALLDGQALAAPLPAVEYLVAQIGLVAGSGAPHLAAGYGSSGKTLILQALALALAGGRAVWGVYSATRRRVVHVDFEQGERLTRRRYQRLALAMGLELAELGDALAVAIMPPLRLQPACADAWRELMVGRDLLIIDSLRVATAGADENSSDIRAGLDLLGGLSEQTGCRALVVHHARKAGEDDPGGRYAIRGSSAIFDAVDSAYVFTAERGEPVKVEHVKARSHGEPVEDFAIVIGDVEVDGDARAGLAARVHGAELVEQRREQRLAAAQRDQVHHDAEAVRRALGGHPGLGTVQLRDEAHLSGARLSRALTSLGDAVEVREESQGRTRVRRHYLRGPK